VVDCASAAETALVPGVRATAADGDGPTARFAWPSGMATDDSGDVFVVDVDSIRRVTPSGAASTVAKAAIAAPIDNDWPIGVASNGAGALYVADPAHHAVRKVVVETGAVSTIALRPPTTTLTQPTALALDRDHGTLYVGDVVDHTIRSIDTTTGQVTLVAGQPNIPGSDDGDAAHATLLFPAGLALDGTSLLVADAGSKTIRALDLPTGELRTIAGAPGIEGEADGAGLSARFLEPIGVAVEADGRVFVVDRLAGAISTLELANGDATDVSRLLGAPPTDTRSLPAPATTLGDAPGQLYLPQAIAFGASGELLVAVPGAVLVAR
jgi:DNA-binding beta-propeller fold protein YncE